MSETSKTCFRYFSAALICLLVASCARNQRPLDIPPAPVTPKAVETKDIAKPPAPSAEEMARQRARKLADQEAAERACARVTIAAVGDIMLGTDFPTNRLPPNDAKDLLADVTPVLKDADIAFGNLEGVLMDGGTPVKRCKDPSACYLFRSPARYALTLAEAGFTVVSLANNHARDFGEAGRSASMDALDSAGIRHSGRMGDMATWPNGQITTALIAFAPFTNSNPMLDMATAKLEVQTLAANYDVVIVSFHGGAEGIDAARIPFATETYYGENRGNVVDFSRTLIDAGADLVIGHGPHVPRAMEIYKERLIAYSLGNFATYYGISITGDKGLAPILLATIDGNGQFINGEIVSAIQKRPNGPVIDSEHRAYERTWELTEQDMAGGGIEFQNGGSFFPLEKTSDACPGPSENSNP
ncbi:MAG: CapA family protein [Gammaproteobacteria bacterium]|nr:CapA family protein [Gammaproteobacteria bacterium]